MSRNQREGHYYGKVRGKHIRCDRWHRHKFGVSSWYAFRIWTDRKHQSRARAA